MSPKPSYWSEQTCDVFDSFERQLAAAVGVVRVAEPSDDPEQDGETSMEGLLARVARQRVELERCRAAARPRSLILKPNLDAEAVVAELRRVLGAATTLRSFILPTEQVTAETPDGFPPGWDVQDLGDGDGWGELTTDGLYHFIATAPGGDITIRARQAIDDPSAYWLVVETTSRTTLGAARMDAIALAWSLPLRLTVEAP